MTDFDAIAQGMSQAVPFAKFLAAEQTRVTAVMKTVGLVK